MEYRTEPSSDVIDRLSGKLGEPDYHIQRRLGDIEGMYEDAQAWAAARDAGDPVTYEVYGKKTPELPGELHWCMSITLPGKIGREYYMTKGHYHEELDTAEVYLCVRGTGYMLMENMAGATREIEMRPDTVVYVPVRWAHRSVNTGNEPLISLCVFPGNAGHDYEKVKKANGFRKRIVEIDGKPAIVDNREQ